MRSYTINLQFGAFSGDNTPDGLGCPCTGTAEGLCETSKGHLFVEPFVYVGINEEDQSGEFVRLLLLTIKPLGQGDQEEDWATLRIHACRAAH